MQFPLVINLKSVIFNSLTQHWIFCECLMQAKHQYENQNTPRILKELSGMHKDFWHTVNKVWDMPQNEDAFMNTISVPHIPWGHRKWCHIYAAIVFNDGIAKQIVGRFLNNIPLIHFIKMMDIHLSEQPRWHWGLWWKRTGQHCKKQKLQVPRHWKLATAFGSPILP